MPRFSAFAGVRYTVGDLSRVVCPPYDVIADAERAALEASDPHNAVRLELPQPEGELDRYAAAAARWHAWCSAGGALAADARPAVYVVRMTFQDEGGGERSTTGVIGALGLDPGGDVLPHEETTSKAKSDRLDLLRATRVNLSPVWGLSLASGLTSLLGGRGEPAARAEANGVRSEVWVVDDADEAAAICARVASAPVVIADGHHRYEVACTYARESGALGTDGSEDSVMALVVELTADELSVAAIHRVVRGLPAGFDVAGALVGAGWFEAAGSAPLDAGIGPRLVEAGAVGVVTGAASEAVLLRPSPALATAAEKDLDSSRVATALASLPPCEVSFQHGWEHVRDAVSSGDAAAGVLLRPATVEQIASMARRHERMPPKTTFFTPKPATGLVFRSLDA